ncbi:MAG TPA: hypothetical protein VGR57_12935 [Ktedonobacterales bacterium]|nr:hypothetical protein [Ktedonobacterales bacterium]
MANAHSAVMADKILSWIKGTTFTAAPANLWVGLFSTAPTTNASNGTEVSGSSYARVQIASSGWSAISQNADTIHDQISNSAALTFPVVTTSSYTVVAIGVWDASTAGNNLWWQTVTSQAVSVGNQYQVAAAALIIEE